MDLARWPARTDLADIRRGGECSGRRVLELLRRICDSNSTNSPSVPFFGKCVRLVYRQIWRLAAKIGAGPKRKIMKKIILLTGIALLAGTAQAQFGGSLNFSRGMQGSRSTIANNVAPASAPQANVSGDNPG